MEAKFLQSVTNMETPSCSDAHAPPSTLTENHSKLSGSSGPDADPCQPSQDGVPESEAASDPALQSGQSCSSNQKYPGPSPMTWTKDGNPEAVSDKNAWSDLFDNQENLELHSRSHWLLLECKSHHGSHFFSSSSAKYESFGRSNISMLLLAEGVVIGVHE